MLRKVAFGTGALLVLLVVIGLFTSPDERDEQRRAQTTTAVEDEPAAAAASPPAPKPKPKPKSKLDTGRMSRTEFDSFVLAHDEVVDESLQFSTEIQACSVIGQTGDLVGFRDCVDSAYSGFDEDVGYAVYAAEELLPDTAKQCQAALRSYAKINRAYQATVALVYDVSNRLAFDEFDGAYGALGISAEQYRKFSTNALSACEPR